TASNINPQVPTPAELANIQAAVGSGSLASDYLNKYKPFTSDVPCPNEAPSAIGHVGCIALIDPGTDPTRSYFGRVDHNFSDRDRLSFTANISREAHTYGKYDGGYVTSVPINAVEHYHFHN